MNSIRFAWEHKTEQLDRIWMNQYNGLVEYKREHKNLHSTLLNYFYLMTL